MCEGLRLQGKVGPFPAARRGLGEITNGCLDLAVAPLRHTNSARLRAPTWVGDTYAPDAQKQAGTAGNSNAISCTTLQITRGFFS